MGIRISTSHHCATVYSLEDIANFENSSFSPEEI